MGDLGCRVARWDSIGLSLIGAGWKLPRYPASTSEGGTATSVQADTCQRSELEHKALGVRAPWINSSWLSFESASSDFWAVSGMRNVEKMPVNMKNAKISRLRNRTRPAVSYWQPITTRESTHMWSRNLPGPPTSLSHWKVSCAMTAPSFPLAAEMPWAVAR